MGHQIPAWQVWPVALLAAIFLVLSPRAASAQVENFEQKLADEVLYQLRCEYWKLGPPLTKGPLRVTLRQIYDRQDAQSEPEKWIRFDLDIGLGKLLPALQVKDLILYRDGSLNLGKERQLVCRHPKKSPFPLGTTGLALYGYEIALCPDQGQASIQADLSTFPGDPRLLRLDGQLTATLPLKKIAFAGKLLVGEHVLGKITEAEIDGESIKGTLIIPGDDVLVPLHRVKAAFQFDRAGLTARGDVAFLKVFRKQLDLALFWDGHGSLESTTELQLPGLHGTSSFHAKFGSGAAALYYQARAVTGFHFGPHEHEIHVGIHLSQMR